MLRAIFSVLTASAIILAVLLVLVFINSRIDPIAWEPSPDPGLKGPFARNGLLSGASLLADGFGTGPEDTTMDGEGYLYTGYLDGRIVKLKTAFTHEDNGGEESEIFANTQGRPLGMQFDRRGHLIVADAMRGLLSISPDGAISVLTDSVNGQKMIFVDDLDIAEDGTIWFSDASTRFGFHDFILDFIEARHTGRLLSYNPSTKETKIEMDGLFFANGVALGPDDEFVLVAESGTSRIHQLWLKGEKAGQKTLFYDGLPGMPDNISFNGVETFWVAIGAVRDPLVDTLASRPLIRKVVGGLPKAFIKPSNNFGFVIGLDSEGNVLHNLQAPDNALHSLTSVNEFNKTLFLGSVVMDSIGVLPAP